jgi:uncharacterized membrane protein
MQRAWRKTVRTSWAALAAAACVVALLASTCAFGDSELSELANHGVPPVPQTDAERRRLYEDYVWPLMVEHCTSCHSDDAQGLAQVDPELDERDDTEDCACRIWVRAVHERSMPPGAMRRLDAFERLVLERWVTGLYRGRMPDCHDMQLSRGCDSEVVDRWEDDNDDD